MQHLDFEKASFEAGLAGRRGAGSRAVGDASGHLPLRGFRCLGLRGLGFSV